MSLFFIIRLLELEKEPGLWQLLKGPGPVTCRKRPWLLVKSREMGFSQCGHIRDDDQVLLTTQVLFLRL